MIGLEGSGFILSVGLTLLIAGTIIYYVNNKFKETAQQLQTVLQIVQQVNSSRGGYAHQPAHQPAHPTSRENPEMVGIEEDDDDLISVSDDEDSDVSSTTTETPRLETTISIDDESAIPENKNIIVDLPIGVAEYISEMSDKSEDSSGDEELGETPEVLLDATSGGDLDTMLLNIIDIHKKSTTTSNLQDLKVTDLREMIKEKGIKTLNLGKLKKSECIELLS